MLSEEYRSTTLCHLVPILLAVTNVSHWLSIYVLHRESLCDLRLITAAQQHQRCDHFAVQSESRSRASGPAKQSVRTYTEQSFLVVETKGIDLQAQGDSGV